MGVDGVLSAFAVSQAATLLFILCGTHKTASREMQGKTKTQAQTRKHFSLSDLCRGMRTILINTWDVH